MKTVETIKLCNDVLTRVRLVEPFEADNAPLPQTYLAGQTLVLSDGNKFITRFFIMTNLTGFVFAEGHREGQRSPDTVLLGRAGEFAEKLVRGERYHP